MRLWYNTGFRGVEPTNTAALVQARTAEEAAAMLSAHLVTIGLAQLIEPASMTQVHPTDTVIILSDGDY